MAVRRLEEFSAQKRKEEKTKSHRLAQKGKLNSCSNRSGAAENTSAYVSAYMTAYSTAYTSTYMSANASAYMTAYMGANANVRMQVRTQLGAYRHPKAHMA
jgi:hypothetical protein